MRNSARLSSGERRQAIVEAVKGLFARKGFDGTTTRELAEAAGVSEALLYRHFPSKESLYAAMLDDCAKGPGLIEYHRILALEPSAATLVVMVHFLISYFALGAFEHADKEAVNRLAVRSLLDDGEFVRVAHRKFTDAFIDKFDKCLKAAAKAGELQENSVRRDLRGWFAHHLGFGLMLHLRPKVPAVNYKVSREALVQHAVWFVLLGAGLKEKAIRRYYNPKALALWENASEVKL
jgi:AcrR family transcriptional regulator